MSQTRVRYAKIKALTLKVLSDFGVVRPPVPITEIISSFGVEIRFGKLGDVSGLFARNSQGAIIGVNEKHVLGRQRFTLAHEFGHFLLHQSLESHADTDFRIKYRDSVSSAATDVEEIEANFFAASILMPLPFLDAANAANALGSDAMVQKLADIFGVSGHAMSLRISNEYASQRPF